MLTPNTAQRISAKIFFIFTLLLFHMRSYYALKITTLFDLSDMFVKITRLNDSYAKRFPPRYVDTF